MVHFRGDFGVATREVAAVGGLALSCFGCIGSVFGQVSRASWRDCSWFGACSCSKDLSLGSGALSCKLTLRSLFIGGFAVCNDLRFLGVESQGPPLYDSPGHYVSRLICGPS